MKGIYTVDKSGRLCLGKEFIGRTFAMSVAKDGSISLVPGQFVPDKEAWLYQNKDAMASLKRGLKQASQGEGAPLSFDLKEDDAWLNDDREDNNEVSAHIPARSSGNLARTKGKRPPKQKNTT